MTAIQETFQQAILSLIEVNRVQQNWFNDQRAKFGNIQFAKDHGIVSVETGRMTGRSTFILRNATERDLVVALNKRMLYSMYRGCRATLTTPNTLKRLVESRFETVYVDDASYVFREIERDDLIARFAGKHNTTFVFLG